VTLFGEPRPPASNLYELRNFDHTIHQRSTFWRLNNPDFCLFRDIDQDSTPLHVYVTDGVQSAADFSIASPSVRILQERVAGGKALAILAFNSRFAGRAWSEQRRAWIGNVDVAGRPFYAFIFAPSEAALEAGLNRLSPQLRGMATELRFPPSPISCRIEWKGHRQQEHTTPPWALLGQRARRASSNGPADLAEYICDIHTGFPAEAVLPTLEKQYRRWLPGEKRFAAASTTPPNGVVFLADSVTTGPSGSRLLIRALMPDDPQTRFGFFEMRIRGRPGLLKFDVRNLSTDSDGSIDDFERTYRFDWLVEHLVRDRFDRHVTPLPAFLTVQYR
jgi:hypothetical protein